jgi:hypothetical protein
MCNLYTITTNQAAISALFRVINRYVGNLPPMPGVTKKKDVVWFALNDDRPLFAAGGRCAKNRYARHG